MTKKEHQISPSQWNELSSEGKEILQLWAVKHGYELDMIPGSSGTFDPVCEYAALLHKEQMELYLQEQNYIEAKSVKKNEQSTLSSLWGKIKLLLEDQTGR